MRGDDRIVPFVYGPILLASAFGSEGILPSGDLNANERPMDYSSTIWVAADFGYLSVRNGAAGRPAPLKSLASAGACHV